MYLFWLQIWWAGLFCLGYHINVSFSGMKKGYLQKITNQNFCDSIKIVTQISTLKAYLLACKNYFVTICKWQYIYLFKCPQFPDSWQYFFFALLLGFEEVSSGCCGTGLLETSFLCNPGSYVCSDASKYVFWDSIHPSEKSYKLLFESAKSDIDFLIADWHFQLQCMLAAYGCDSGVKISYSYFVSCNYLAQRFPTKLSNLSVRTTKKHF